MINPRTWTFVEQFEAELFAAFEERGSQVTKHEKSAHNVVELVRGWLGGCGDNGNVGGT